MFIATSTTSTIVLLSDLRSGRRPNRSSASPDGHPLEQLTIAVVGAGERPHQRADVARHRDDDGRTRDDDDLGRLNNTRREQIVGDHVRDTSNLERAAASGRTRRHRAGRSGRSAGACAVGSSASRGVRHPSSRTAPGDMPQRRPSRRAARTATAERPRVGHLRRGTGVAGCWW